MSRTLLMVGTRKGMWLGTSDEARRSWEWTGPHFPMEEVYSVMIDSRGESPRLLAGASSSWLGPQVWRSDDLGASWDETPNGAARFPEDTGATLARVWQLQPGFEDDVVWAGHRAGRDLPLDRPRRDLLAGARAVGPPAPARSGTRASAARPSTRSCPHPRDGDQVLAALSTGGVYATEDGGSTWVPVEHRREGGVLPRRAQLPRVRAVRAQGGPRRRRPRPALPAEPRRRLPLRRRRILAGRTSRRGCRPSSASRWWPTPTGPTRRTTSRSPAPRPAGRSTARPGSTAPPTPASSWEPLGEGALPDGYFTAVMRDAMCVDDHEQVGLYFGGRNGGVWASPDEGGTWQEIHKDLPDVLVVRAAQTRTEVYPQRHGRLLALPQHPHPGGRRAASTPSSTTSASGRSGPRGRASTPT